MHLTSVGALSMAKLVHWLMQQGALAAELCNSVHQDCHTQESCFVLRPDPVVQGTDHLLTMLPSFHTPTI